MNYIHEAAEMASLYPAREAPAYIRWTAHVHAASDRDVERIVWEISTEWQAILRTAKETARSARLASQASHRSEKLEKRAAASAARTGKIATVDIEAPAAIPILSPNNPPGGEPRPEPGGTTVIDYASVALAIAPIDEAFRQSETKWGVGRLERLVSTATLEAYRRGWSLYRAALDASDAQALTALAPRLAAMLAYLDAEATRAGHGPVAPDAWEAPLTGGAVLVVVRTNAEASAVLRGSEGRLPPDLVATVRHQHEGRHLEVWTMAEIARLIDAVGSPVSGIKAAFPGAAVTAGHSWEGTPAYSGIQRDEHSAADNVRSGFPLQEPLT